jgi:hypothetical protein
VRAAPVPGGSLGVPGRTAPRPGTSPAPPPPPAPGEGAAGACSNGIDDDRDGQVDASSERERRPDPGCMAAGDTTENSEVAVSAACAASSGAGAGGDQDGIGVGINSGCGTFTEVAVYAAPNAYVCDVFTADDNFNCVIRHGHAYAETRDARETGIADVDIGLVGRIDCSVPATIALTRRDGTVAELVTPIARCGVAKPACANGADDDGDGLADARDAAGATDPDPGCSGPADASEDSEVALPAGCSVTLATFNGDELFPGVVIEGCGAVAGAWLKPSAEPFDCVFQIGDGASAACAVTGATAGATFAATTDVVLLGAHTLTLPPCGPVTVALTLAGGTVAKGRGDWC